MNTKIFALALIALVIFASGCVGTPAKEEVKTAADAQKATQDVGASVGDVAADIADIDKGLSG